MKVVCIDNKSPNLRIHFPLTIGKIYDVYDKNSNIFLIHYLVVNDMGMKIWYSNIYLMDLYKYREIKLEKLGI